MTYQKMTPASWLTKVRNDSFTSASNAMKSTGRAAWSDKIKTKMRAYADLHFEGGEITDRDIELAGNNGGKPDPKPHKKRGKKRDPQKAKATVSHRKPVRLKVEKMESYPSDTEVPLNDPYREIRSTIYTAHAALQAFKLAHEADPRIVMPDELIDCIDLVSACVRYAIERVPAEVRVALEEIRAEAASLDKANEEEEPSPKAHRAATPAALFSKTPLRLDGVPLESNKEGEELWRKLAETGSKRSNGKNKDKRD